MQKRLKINMGSADRLIRILAASAIIVLFSIRVLTGTWGYILLTLASINLIASFVGNCPLYSLIGIRTCKTKKH